MDDPAIEEEAEPRFLLFGSSEPLQADAVAAVLAVLQPAALAVGAGWDRGLLELARDHGVALLVEDDFDPAADGVHLRDPGRVSAIRAELDRQQDRLILGADVGLSRHEAMVAGEAGVDYVAFGERGVSADDEVLECVEWWRSTTILPCLAYAEDTEIVTRLVEVGADFIGVSRTICENPEGSAALARNLAAALEKT